MTEPTRRSPLPWRVASLIVLGLAAWGGRTWWQQSRAVETETRLRSVLQQLEQGQIDRQRLSDLIDRLGQSPRHASVLPLLHGALALAEGEPAEALAELTRLEPGGATRKPALLLVGQALTGAGRPVEAAAVYRQLVELDPAYLPARYALSRYWYDRGSVAQARFELDQITRIAPREWRAWRELGGHAFDFSRYAEAVKYLEEALPLEPPPADRQEILLELGQSHFFRREYDDAVERFSQANPTPLSESLKAEALAALGRREESQAALAKGAELDPRDRTVRLVTARLAIQEGEPERALAPLLEQLQANPHDRECRFQLAQAYTALGRSEEATREREQFAELDRQFDRYTDLSTRVTSEPGNIPLREELAELCAQLGQPTQAAAWRKAVQILKQEQASREGSSAASGGAPGAGQGDDEEAKRTSPERADPTGTDRSGQPSAASGSTQDARDPQPAGGPPR